MLVLTRHLGQQVKIDGPCIITLVDIDRGQVRLGFEADRDVSILRTELMKSKDQAAPQRKRRDLRGGV